MTDNPTSPDQPEDAALRKRLNEVSKQYFVQYGTARFSAYLDDIMQLFHEQQQEKVQAAVASIREGLEDVCDEVRIGNDMTWRQIVNWDDVEEIFESRQATQPPAADTQYKLLETRPLPDTTVTTDHNTSKYRAAADTTKQEGE